MPRCLVILHILQYPLLHVEFQNSIQFQLGRITELQLFNTAANFFDNSVQSKSGPDRKILKPFTVKINFVVIRIQSNYHVYYELWATIILSLTVTAGRSCKQEDNSVYWGVFRRLGWGQVTSALNSAKYCEWHNDIFHCVLFWQIFSTHSRMLATRQWANAFISTNIYHSTLNAENSSMVGFPLFLSV